MKGHPPTRTRRLGFNLLLTLTVGLSPLWARGQSTAGANDKDKKDIKRPTLSLKASPMVAFSPARIMLTADLRGGANDYEDYYCPTIEWDWGDETKSESTADCEPYEAGKSEIRRHFTTQHVYRMSGEYRVQITLKRKDKALVAANVNVQVRPGLAEPPSFPH